MKLDIFKKILPARFRAGRERGISLIEAVLYLVIALAVVGGGIFFFQSAQNSNRSTETSRGLVSISSDVRALFQSDAAFGPAAPGTNLDQLLIDTRSVGSFAISGSTISHPWGGDLTVTGIENTFTIQLDDVPRAACARLVTVDERGQGPAGIGITEVEVDGTAVTTLSTLPITATQASGACTAALNDITFTYSR